MSEENVEQKPKKHVLKVVIPIVLILAVAGVAIFFIVNKINSKPEKVFDSAIENMAEKVEKTYTANSARAELSVSAEINALSNADPQIKTQISMINSLLKTASIDLVAEVDMEKQLLNYEVKANYMGEKLLSAEAFIQDGKVYAYLDNLYSKYIEIPTDVLKEANLDVATIFKAGSDSQSKELVNDIADILKERIKDSDVKSESAEISVKGKDTKVNQSTLTITSKELANILVEVINKVSSYETNSELKSQLSQLARELKDVDETDGKLVINIYSEKVGNKIVGWDIKIIDDDKSEVGSVQGRQTGDKTWTYSLYENYDGKKQELMTLSIEEKNDNEGTIKVTVKMEEEGMEGSVKVDYKYQPNVSVSKKNVTNSIRADKLTEKDAQEILNNIQNNAKLKSLIESLGGDLDDLNLGGSSSNYDDYDNYYNSDYDFNSTYNYDFNYNYNSDYDFNSIYDSVGSY